MTTRADKKKLKEAQANVQKAGVLVRYALLKLDPVPRSELDNELIQAGDAIDKVRIRLAALLNPAGNGVDHGR